MIGRAALRGTGRAVSNPRLGGGMSDPTQRQMELRPIVQELKGDRDNERRGLRPVEMFFDLLQRGNYMSANSINAVLNLQKEGIPPEDAMQYVLSQAWEGLSGRDKTLFKDVISEHIPSMDKPLITNKAGENIPVISGISNPANVAGFVLDIVLDPTTYITFGANKKAKAAANMFAEQKMKVAMKDPETVQSIYRRLLDKTKNPKVAKNAIEAGKKSPQAMQDILAKYNATEVYRDMYNRFYREGLRSTETQAKRSIAEQLSKFGDKTDADKRIERAVREHLKAKQFKRITADHVLGKKRNMKQLSDKIKPTEVHDLKMKVKKALADGNLNEIPAELRSHILNDSSLTTLAKGADGTLVPNVNQQYFDDVLNASGLQDSFQGAGERTFKLFGRDVFKYAEGSTAATRSFDAFTDALKQSKLGTTSNAIGSWLDASPVGALRRGLGFRDPYERMLRAKELDIIEHFPMRLETERLQLEAAFSGYDEAMKQKFVRVKAQADKMVRSKKGYSFEDAIQYLTKKGELKDVDKALLREFNDKYVNTVTRWANLEIGWAEEGLVNAYQMRDEYISHQFRTLKDKAVKVQTKGTHRPGTTLESKMGLEKGLEEQVSIYADLFGVDKKLMKNYAREVGLPTINTQFDKIMMERAYAHARIAKRADFVKTFREFGINVDEIKHLNKAFAEALTSESKKELLTSPTFRDFAGLHKIEDTGFNGYLFDSEVAKIADRTMSIIDDDRVANRLLGLFDAQTQWFKGVVTSSPGFHARNAMSNNVIGFMKHGPRWFNMRDARDSFVLSLTTLKGEEAAKKALKNIGVGDDAYVKIMNRVIGKDPSGNPVKLNSLVDYLKRKGVASRASHGFDDNTVQMAMGEAISTMNPMSKNFALFGASREVGSLIESTDRTHAFLLDVIDLSKGGSITDTVLEFAKMESKKWFLDYRDLTSFERNVMKRVIPFYSWIRKNTANQVSMLFDPQMWGRLSLQPKAFNMFEDKDVERSELYDYQRRRGDVIIGENEAGPITMWPNIPFMDLNVLPLGFGESGMPRMRPLGTIASEFIGMSNPVLKSTVELATNHDTFRGTQMPDRSVTSKLLGPLQRVPKAVAFLDGVFSMAFEDGLGYGIDNDGRVIVNSKVAKLLENNLPILRQFERFLDGPEELLKTDSFDLEQKINEILGAKGRHEDIEQPLKELLSTISFWTGVKFDAVDAENKWFWDSRDLVNKAERLRREGRKGTPGYEFRSRKWTNQNRREYKRFGL